MKIGCWVKIKRKFNTVIVFVEKIDGIGIQGYFMFYRDRIKKPDVYHHSLSSRMGSFDWADIYEIKVII